MESHIYEFQVTMTCEGCVNAVRKALGNHSDVTNVDVDLKAQTVLVTTMLSVEELSNILSKTGKQYVFKGLKS